MSEHFDVAILGMELPGIIAAALLAKRGRRVVILDHGDSASSYTRHGVVLPRVPSLAALPSTSPHMQRIHDELSLTAAVQALTHSPDPSFQAILNKHRCDLRGASQSLQYEVTAEFPELGDEAQAWANRVVAIDQRICAMLEAMPDTPPSSWMERWQTREMAATCDELLETVEASELFAHIPAQHPLRTLLTAPLAFLGNLWAPVPSTLHAVRALAGFIRGCAGVLENTSQLHDLMMQHAVKHGVQLRRNAVIAQVHRKRRILTEVQLIDCQAVIRADFFLNNCFTPFSDLLPANARQLTSEEHHMRATRSLLVQNIIVRKEVIPEAMARAVFMLDGRQSQRDDAPADPALFVQRNPIRKVASNRAHAQAIDPDTHEVLTVACPVRVRDVAHAGNSQAIFESQALARLGRLIPYLADHVVDVSHPLDTRGWDDLPARSDTPHSWWSAHPLFETTAKPILGVFCRPVQTYFQNMAHCGRDVVPAFGLEGEYITAWAAVSWLHKRAGRNWL